MGAQDNSTSRAPVIVVLMAVGCCQGGVDGGGDVSTYRDGVGVGDDTSSGVGDVSRVSSSSLVVVVTW